jgi:ketosteroid isomerase-like protein
VYALLARRRVRKTFERLSRAEWDAVVAELSDDVLHAFPGHSPLGGTRHSREAVRGWFDRLGRLYPGHDFEVGRIAVAGPPWDLSIAVSWTARLRPAVGTPYENAGAHWIRVRRGRVVEFHAYLDTQLIAEACQVMADAGIEEAAAPPITG